MTAKGFHTLQADREPPREEATEPKGDLGPPLVAIMGLDPSRPVVRFDERGRMLRPIWSVS